MITFHEPVVAEHSDIPECTVARFVFTCHRRAFDISRRSRTERPSTPTECQRHHHSAGQSISISRLDWLLSEFRLRQRNGDWLSGGDQVAFLSIGKNRTNFLLPAPPPGEYDRLSFRIGLNPQLNASEPTVYGPEHPLNPVLNGLHWSWQGGYVFLAAEGRWRDSTESGGFSYHLGNDHMMMRVELPSILSLPTKDNLILKFSIDELLGAIPRCASTTKRPPLTAARATPSPIACRRIRSPRSNPSLLVRPPPGRCAKKQQCGDCSERHSISLHLRPSSAPTKVAARQPAHDGRGGVGPTPVP